MNGFLNKDNVIENFSSFDEAALVFQDDPRKDSFKPGGYYLGNKLVPGIA